MPFWSRNKRFEQRRSYHPWELDFPLLQLNEDESSAWTLRSLVEHCLILGKPGSGKTSSSVANIGAAVIRSGHGILAYCAKPDEKDLWLRRLGRGGRLEQTIIFDANGKWKFNPISYLYGRPGAGAGLGTIGNIANFIMDMMKLAEKGEQQGGEDSVYWTRSTRQLLEHVLSLAAMSEGELQITTVYDILMSLPRSMEETTTEKWILESACSRHLVQAKQRDKSEMEERDFAVTAQYILETWAGINPKTSSIIKQMTGSLIERTFLKGYMREVFASRTCNLLPELVFDQGACVILDWDPRTWGDLGLMAQHMFGWVFMDAIERRDTIKYPRPVTTFIDEAPIFVSDKLAAHIRTVRSAASGVVVAGQNLNSFYANGMDKEAVGDLVGACGTTVGHLQSCPITNDWLSRSIGAGRYTRPNWNISMGEFGSAGSSSSGGSEEERPDVPAQFFTQIPKPGPDGLVTGVFFEPGRVWPDTGRPWTLVGFPQEPRN